VIGEDPLARGGLAALLRGVEGLDVAAAVSPGEAALKAVRELLPDLAVWDPLDEPFEGFDTPQTPTVVLVTDAAGAREALAAGARGVLARDGQPKRLAAALHAIDQGFLVIDRAWADALRPQPVLNEPIEALTPREYDVLELLTEGLSNRDLAKVLGFSEHTAKFHVQALLNKLGASTRTELVVRALRLGLLPL
jgi:DNA-binding NarL/FixJ family response regulator